MRKQIMRWMSGVAFLATLALVFTQCELGMSETTPANNLDVSMRGGGPGPVDNNRPDICACLTAEFGTEDLSLAERKALLLMREEEKLARDIYQGLYQKWDLPVFANIARSEQRHMDAVLCLLNKYELTDPVGDNGPGIFQDESLRTLYQELQAKGAVSLQEALIVGATIEDLDIRDLMRSAEDPEVNNQDVLAVFGALTKGSRNHLRAFNAQLDRVGAVYQAQYLDAALYQTILTSEWERGGNICGVCNGAGPGAGSGECLYFNRQGRAFGPGNRNPGANACIGAGAGRFNRQNGPAQNQNNRNRRGGN